MAIRLFAAAIIVGLLAGSASAAEPARAPTAKSPAPPGPPRVSVTLLIEYDNTQNNANHIHSVWRDPRRDFGLDLLRAHYEHGHHHRHA